MDDSRVNGVVKTASNDKNGPLPEICYELRNKLLAFLDETIEHDETLQNVQRQVRISIGVIDDALRRYGCVIPPSELSHGKLQGTSSANRIILSDSSMFRFPTMVVRTASSSSS